MMQLTSYSWVYLLQPCLPKQRTRMRDTGLSVISSPVDQDRVSSAASSTNQTPPRPPARFQQRRSEVNHPNQSDMEEFQEVRGQRFSKAMEEPRLVRQTLSEISSELVRPQKYPLNP